MTSIRLRLLLVLLLATGAVWGGALLWTRAQTEAHVERVLDARLAEAARMVASLVADGRVAVADAAEMPAALVDAAGDGAAYEHRLACQVWTLDGGLLGRSQGAPAARLSPVAAGFGDAEVDGVAWRVFAVEDQGTGVRVMVGDTRAVRDNLVEGMVGALMTPLALALPLLALAIWAAVGHGLGPLDRLARAVAGRDAADLAPLSVGPTPRELRPLVSALDGLLARVARAREAERSFTAFAAHELKTPLAGLRTQAQVAAMAPDEATRARALAQVARAVERTDRLARQLLDLAGIEAGPVADDVGPLGHAMAEAADDAGSLLAACGLTLGQEVEPAAGLARMPLLPIRLALRNLLENAAAWAPAGSEVRVAARIEEGRLRLAVEDAGPGILADELEAVRARFVRGRRATGAGSGLGLAIVELAAARLGGRLDLRAGPAGGLRATLDLPGPKEPPEGEPRPMIGRPS